MRRFSCASHSRHPTASQRCTSSPKDHAGAWADELVLDTHVADAGLTFRRLTLSSSSAPFRRQRRSVTRLVVDHLISPMMIKPTSIRIKLLCNHPLFVLLEDCTAHSLSACDQSLTLSAAARSLFVNSTPSFQSIHSLIGVTDAWILAGSSPGSRSPCIDAHRLRDMTIAPCRKQS